MTIMHEIELGDAVVAWEAWRCTAGSCAEDFLRLRRRSRGEDVWLLYERPGWVMAASVPVCPGCGSAMRRQSRAQP